jgi:hypothetical protein
MDKHTSYCKNCSCSSCVEHRMPRCSDCKENVAIKDGPRCCRCETWSIATHLSDMNLFVIDDCRDNEDGILGDLLSDFLNVPAGSEFLLFADDKTHNLYHFWYIHPDELDKGNDWEDVEISRLSFSFPGDNWFNDPVMTE